MISDDIDISETSNSAKLQLPPEHLGRMHHGGDELDPLRRDTAFEQRPRALVVGERDTQLEVGSGHDRTSFRGRVISQRCVRRARCAACSPNGRRRARDRARI